MKLSCFQIIFSVCGLGMLFMCYSQNTAPNGVQEASGWITWGTARFVIYRYRLFQNIYYMVVLCSKIICTIIYQKGQGVKKDTNNVLYQLDQVAIGGHSLARWRYNLGAYEWRSGRQERAVKHYIIAANLGHDLALETLREAYKKGCVSKEDFWLFVHKYQAAVDATKSEEAFRRNVN